MVWIPPRSPFDLIQEQLYDDPWKLLAACIFCNMTRRKQAEPLMWEFFRRFPNPEEAAAAHLEDLEKLLTPLGLQQRRAQTLVRFSAEFTTKDWSDPIELHGIGAYAKAAWQIFCRGTWRDIPRPKDHALAWYYDWLHETQRGTSEQS